MLICVGVYCELCESCAGDAVVWADLLFVLGLVVSFLVWLLSVFVGLGGSACGFAGFLGVYWFCFGWFRVFSCCVLLRLRLDFGVVSMAVGSLLIVLIFRFVGVV